MGASAIDSPATHLSGIRVAALGVVAVVVTVILDQLSKAIVLRELGPDAGRHAVTLVPGVLDLRFVRNTGSAFGLFQGGSDWLKIVAILAVALLAVYFVREARHDWLLSLALGLQVGGALGNIIDRFQHGYVVDFIDFPRFPTFNIADSAITIGVILLMYGLMFRDTLHARHAQPAPARREPPVAAVED